MYAPKDEEGGSSWAQGYHNKLYSLTDSAIRGALLEHNWSAKYKHHGPVMHNGDPQVFLTSPQSLNVLDMYQCCILALKTLVLNLYALSVAQKLCR